MPEPLNFEQSNAFYLAPESVWKYEKLLIITSFKLLRQNQVMSKIPRMCKSVLFFEIQPPSTSNCYKQIPGVMNVYCVPTSALHMSQALHCCLQGIRASGLGKGKEFLSSRMMKYIESHDLRFILNFKWKIIPYVEQMSI